MWTKDAAVFFSHDKNIIGFNEPGFYREDTFLFFINIRGIYRIDLLMEVKKHFTLRPGILTLVVAAKAK